VSDKSYDDDKVLAIMGNSHVQDATTVRNNESSQLHVSCDLPHHDVRF